ncbi:MAG: MBOAT family protein [Mogibacterium sp.]|nr:MBOAT family protein [Mogibacterium sp.]
MTFTSLIFAIFAAVTILLYFALPLGRNRWVVLLAASYFFYVYNSYKYTAFILLTTATIYAAAVRMESISEKTKALIKEKKAELSREERKALKKQAESRRKTLLALTLLLNFGILFMLKYLNFLAGGLMSLLGGADRSGGTEIIHLLLPLGISFYTFQATGYLIDVYRETVRAERNPAKFALFVSFFPQIVQGPISTFEHLGEQLFADRKPEWIRFKTGGELILWGMFKKLIIADRAVNAVTTVSGDYWSYSGEMILFAALLYAFQLYADFSGGIDIARGVARILGIDLEVNFRQSYFSRSISEYWRRWHITLGAWMKKYVFYSLAVSKGFMNMSKAIGSGKYKDSPVVKHIAKTLPTALASFIVFLLIGIWHGANSRYIGFGLWNGAVIAFSALMMPVYERALKALRIRAESWIWQGFQMLRTFVIILVGYYFDIAPDLRGAIDMMKRSVFDLHGVPALSQLRELGLYRSDLLVLAYGFVIMLFFSIRLEKTGIETPGDLLCRRPAWIQWIAIFIGIMSLLLFGMYGSGYDAADFIYMGF